MRARSAPMIITTPVPMPFAKPSKIATATSE
jgi:hypothetical protein